MKVLLSDPFVFAIGPEMSTKKNRKKDPRRSSIRFRSGFTLILGFLTLLCLHMVRGDSAHISSPPASPDSPAGSENACILVLCRESDLDALVATLGVFEKRFNHAFRYPYVILNNMDFSEKFKQTLGRTLQAPIEFGKVPEEHWGYPSWVDREKAKKKMREMEKKGVLYGGLESYRHMCRFFSGFFYKHPLVQKYRYYWRVEPGTRLRCPVNYDVFRLMRERNKKYGWVIAIHEYGNTIPSLWDAVKRFVADYNTAYKPESGPWSLFAPKNLERFVTDEMYTKYNMCHMWSNFEIADMSFFRSRLYEMFFEHLDRSGGFFYERWGDAPVHTIAVCLLLPREQIHYFEDIGYTHPPFTHCPSEEARAQSPATSQQQSSASNPESPVCDCQPSASVSLSIPGCTSLYKKIFVLENT